LWSGKTLKTQRPDICKLSDDQTILDLLKFFLSNAFDFDDFFDPVELPNLRPILKNALCGCGTNSRKGLQLFSISRVQIDFFRRNGAGFLRKDLNGTESQSKAQRQYTNNLCFI
jgi:hypothetical protein